MTDVVVATEQPIDLVEAKSQDVVVVVEEVVNVVEAVNTVVVVEEVVNVVEAARGPIGSAGPAGTSEDAVPYAARVDFVGTDTIYRGEADPGVASSAASWRIRRITLNAEGDATTEWADGDSSFDNIWDNRAALSYS